MKIEHVGQLDTCEGYTIQLHWAQGSRRYWEVLETGFIGTKAECRRYLVEYKKKLVCKPKTDWDRCKVDFWAEVLKKKHRVQP